LQFEACPLQGCFSKIVCADACAAGDQEEVAIGFQLARQQRGVVADPLLQDHLAAVGLDECSHQGAV
jgi:hypothetical protein